jgi:hypothetical protein
MAFQTVTFSGSASGTSGSSTTTGTFTASIMGNADGSLSGTWSFHGTYRDSSPYYPSSGAETIEGTLSGSGPSGGPWTLSLAGVDAVDHGLSLSYSGGQYTLSVNAGYGVDVAFNNGYDGIYTFHDNFVFQAALSAAGAAPGGVATEGADSLAGTSGAEFIMAMGGNDTITAGGGNDTIDGGAGIDTAMYSDVRANYTVTNNGNGTFTVTHSGADGTDTLTNVERLVFSDAKVAIDIDGHGGQAFRLYQAAFSRTPDVPGLGFQINALDSGLTLSQVAGNFIASPEFQATYGANISNTQFVTLLYQNVLHRAPDSGGLQFHLDELANNQTRADVLTHFSESPENEANVIGAIQNGMAFTF